MACVDGPPPPATAMVGCTQLPEGDRERLTAALDSLSVENCRFPTSCYGLSANTRKTCVCAQP
eukprot:5936491-Pyramimonas_sp.AAC.1